MRKGKLAGSLKYANEALYLIEERRSHMTASETICFWRRTIPYGVSWSTTAEFIMYRNEFGPKCCVFW